MPWDPVTLNDGRSMPSIAYGTWTLGNGQGVVDQVEQALNVGFSHIDTAQAYQNEAEAGQAFKESGLARNDVFITTKWSGRDGLDIQTSIHNSLKHLGVDYVDLYLIHSPRLAQPDISTVWAQMEKVKADGLAKSIGISNFDAVQTAELLAHAKVKPVVNQILFHPYVYVRQAPVVAAAKAAGIVIEAYSLLMYVAFSASRPITHQPGGPLDKPLARIGARLGATADQVLMAWAISKGVVVVTTSSKESRLKGYLSAADLELTTQDIADIDAAGAIGQRRMSARVFVQRAVVVALVGAAALGVCGYLGVEVF
ncbi:Aldo/keto reductase [Sanghuangporus baumii]|uniref:Aldo/keto reductase n=1 Tax=Sanghuangporus baumii TaxID=108892 RepID=A0A9Q5NEF6_SANBA|nr:Aldo/keto reductase [Sanghuangporus baumii]